MSLDEFQKAWQSENSQPPIVFNATLLTAEVERSSEAFRSVIFRRHLGQIEAVLWMTLFYWLVGIVRSSPWTWYLMIPVFLWMAIVYLWTLKQYSKRPFISGQTVLESVKASLAQVEHQTWLMRSLPSWNFMPVVAALFAYVAQATWEMTLPWWGRFIIIGVWAFLLYYFFRWMRRMNDLSVQKELEPRRSDLKKIIKNLESESAGDEGELRDVVIGLAESDGPAKVQYDTAKAIESWNRLIPSWREVLYLVVPTLLSAYCVTHFPFDSTRTMLIQSTRVASVTFAIAFLIVGFVSKNRHKHPSLSGSDNTRYNTPAMVTMRLIMLMVTLGSVAFLSQTTETKSLPVEKPKSSVSTDLDQSQR